MHSPDRNAMWILQRDGTTASAVFQVNFMKIEVYVLVDGKPVQKQTFDSGDEASAWAKQERQRMIAEDGWQDTRTPADSFRRAAIFLYQPDDALAVLGIDVDALATYQNELVDTVIRACTEIKTPQPLQVVVAVRPGQRCRIWLVVEPGPDQPNASGLREALERVRPPSLKRGPLVFALTGALADGRPRKVNGPDGLQPPLPDEWKTVMAGATCVEDVVNRAWPEKRPNLFSRWWVKSTAASH